MMTVHEVSKLTGVSIRTLQYYDEIGLLHPAEHTEAGYRLYDEAALERLQQILLFRELEFPLKEIRRILDRPDFDRNRALEQQIQMLTLKREHIDDLIRMAQGIRMTGVKYMCFEAFDTKKMEEYAREARTSWGTTDAYREFETRNSGRPMAELKGTGRQLMALLAEFGAMKDGDAAAPEAQRQVKRLQDFITEQYYTCTDEILAQLGKMYGSGGEFTENIDRAGGAGTAAFAAEAIDLYCRGK